MATKTQPDKLNQDERRYWMKRLESARQSRRVSVSVTFPEFRKWLRTQKLKMVPQHKILQYMLEGRLDRSDAYKLILVGGEAWYRKYQKERNASNKGENDRLSKIHADYKILEQNVVMGNPLMPSQIQLFEKKEY